MISNRKIGLYFSAMVISNIETDTSVFIPGADEIIDELHYPFALYRYFILEKYNADST